MTLYTIMPFEKVFEGFAEYSPEYLELDVNGMTMQVEMISPNRAKIVRLFSPIPADYLNPNYSPGSLIELPYTFRTARV
jgi:hypothetical protein